MKGFVGSERWPPTIISHAPTVTIESLGWIFMTSSAGPSFRRHSNTNEAQFGYHMSRPVRAQMCQHMPWRLLLGRTILLQAHQREKFQTRRRKSSKPVSRNVPNQWVGYLLQYCPWLLCSSRSHCVGSLSVVDCTNMRRLWCMLCVVV